LYVDFETHTNNRISECLFQSYLNFLSLIIMKQKQMIIMIKKYTCLIILKMFLFCRNNYTEKNVYTKENNYVKRLSVDDNAAKSFNILTTSLNVLHNYFAGLNKIISRCISIAKFLDILTKFFLYRLINLSFL